MVMLVIDVDLVSVLKYTGMYLNEWYKKSLSSYPENIFLKIETFLKSF